MTSSGPNGRPRGTTAMTEERFRRRYGEVYGLITEQGYREPSDRRIADALGLHPRTLHRYRTRFGLPRGSTG